MSAHPTQHPSLLRLPNGGPGAAALREQSGGPVGGRGQLDYGFATTKAPSGPCGFAEVSISTTTTACGEPTVRRVLAFPSCKPFAVTRGGLVPDVVGLVPAWSPDWAVRGKPDEAGLVPARSGYGEAWRFGWD